MEEFLTKVAALGRMQEPGLGKVQHLLVNCISASLKHLSYPAPLVHRA